MAVRLVAVDLDEPPAGHPLNGQWFKPDELRKAPFNIIIKDKNCYYMQLLLQRKPYKRQKLALKDSGANLIRDGVYEVTSVEKPPSYLASQFQWEVQLTEVRSLREDDRPILVGKYR